MRRNRTALLLAFVSSFSLAVAAGANVYTVVNTHDTGAGSLRWAIGEANGHAGPDSVAFNVPGAGPHTIAVQSPLPSLGAGTSVLGTTQPGYAGAPLIRIDGGNLAANVWGFDTDGASLTIAGLEIVRFQGPGVRVFHDHVVVRGNRIGNDGSVALANAGSGVHCFSGSALVVGGNVAQYANVLSGNAGAGLALEAGCSGAVVRGNRIGTNAAGTAALPNGDGGVRIWGSGHTIGGSGANEPNTISGNAFSGILLGDSATNNQIAGNRIGTNAAGSAAIGNAWKGIDVHGDANTIGGTTAGAGNLISGNASDGLVLATAASLNAVRGNRIGTDLAGTAALGNGGSGIALFGAENVIGGDSVGARNLISGNASEGIAIPSVLGGSDGNQIVGNYIGTNVAGTAALGNGGYGIRALTGVGNEVRENLISGNWRAFSLEFDATGYLVKGNVIGLNAAMSAKLANQSNGLDISSPGHRIGGAQPGEGNVLAGNAYSGIWISGAGAVGAVLEGNWIGTNPAGAAGLGNSQSGIMVTESGGHTIGGTEAGTGNVVAHNGYLGIFVWSGEGNAILGNSIHDNGLLGIDLDPQGPVANDVGDWDAGANRGQNFPVVTSALASGGDLEVEGFLDAHPATEYRIELFSNATFDATGVGEGENYLGAVIVVTDASGRAMFAATVPAAGGDAFVTATATGPSFDTSEFSPAIAIGAPQSGQIQIWRDLLLSYEGTPGIDVTLVRSHGVAGTVSVDVATVDGTAQAPGDYGSVAATLTFQPGETMKSVFVPIVTDAAPESDETWRLQLANPQGGAALGANSDVLAWLFNATLEWPMYSIGDAEIVEGDDGSRSLVFTVTLSPTGHDLPIQFWTSDGAAVAGEDYSETTGELLFQPGEGAKTISVPVLGDSMLEPDESLYVHLYALGNGVVWDGLGEGRILDDDGGSTNFIFADDFESGDPEAWSSIAGWP